MARVANFFYTGKHFASVEAFEDHIFNYAVPVWETDLGRGRRIKTKPIGITLHHTYRPTIGQWRGAASIDSLARFYRSPRAGDGTGNGWDRGPHLFIAPDGIWELTPMNMPGIHAGNCNPYRFGIEHVGDYDRALWPEPIHSLSIGVQAALAAWAGFDTSAIVGHRDCLNNKSCPGNAVYAHLPAYRAEVGARISAIRTNRGI